MSKLLISEHPLIVLPSLALALGGSDPAIVLQQIHYWIADPRAPERDARRWHYATFPQWLKQFPWISLRTLKRIMAKLEGMKIVISSEPNAKKGDRTKWYTIDYTELSKLEISANTHSAKLALPSGQIGTTIGSNWHHPYKEEETTKETTKEKQQQIPQISKEADKNRKDLPRPKQELPKLTKPLEVENPPLEGNATTTDTELVESLVEMGYKDFQAERLIFFNGAVKVRAGIEATLRDAVEDRIGFLRAWLISRKGVTLEEADKSREQVLNKKKMEVASKKFGQIHQGAL